MSMEAKLIVVCVIIFLCLAYGILPTYFYKIHRYIKRNKNSKRKVIYLTFDDGPDPNYTPTLLKLLKKYDIKGTFFVLGEYVENNPDIIKLMKDDGHTIGLHWYKHKSALIQSPSETAVNFERGINALRNLGVDVKYFRPPWGQFNLSMICKMKSLGLKVFLWDVMAEDWEMKTSKDIIKSKLEKRVFDGCTVCLHDGRGENCAPAKMIQALEELIPEWIAMGYEFKKAEDTYER